MGGHMLMWHHNNHTWWMTHGCSLVSMGKPYRNSCFLSYFLHNYAEWCMLVVCPQTWVINHQRSTQGHIQSVKMALMEESLEIKCPTETPTASFETSAQPKTTQKKSHRESVDVNHRFSAITFLICDKYYRSVGVCCGVDSSLWVCWSVYERLNWMWACFLLGSFYSCLIGMGPDCHACFSWKSWKIQFDQSCHVPWQSLCSWLYQFMRKSCVGTYGFPLLYGPVLCIHMLHCILLVFCENTVKT